MRCADFARLVAVCFTGAMLAGAAQAQSVGATSQTAGDEQLSPARFVLLGIEVRQATVLAPTDIEEVAKRWRGQLIGGYELLAIARELTARYTEKGYAGSGVVLADQAIGNGTVVFTAREVRLAKFVMPSPPRWLRQSAIEHLLWPDRSKPLHLPTLQDHIAMSRDSPHLTRIDADLAVGVPTAAEATLTIAVEEPSPIQAWLSSANNRSPSIGAIRSEAGIAHRSLTGWGDSIEYRRGRTEGLDDSQWSYVFPVPRSRLTLHASRGRADSRAIEPLVFRDLDIVALSNSDTLGATYTVFRSPDQVLSAGFSADRRTSSTSLLGIPFSFTLGLPDGESEVRARRLSLEYVFRDANQNASVRVIGTAGKVTPTIDQDIAGAVNPDYRLLQFGATYVRRFNASAWELRLRLDGQFTGDTLAPVERLSFGGSNSVRGYRENLFLRDTGAVLRTEVVARTIEFGSWLRVTPGMFADAAWGRDSHPRDDGAPKSIAGAGLSLESQIGKHLRIGVAWARGFNRSFANGGNLQDRGVQFNAVVSYP
ncbi:MAG: ShlB/FhaC/HecB family hemolysin secretion/activation protein [Burkholderiales bacterium]|nr:ShlB/FhaC/HecB family hemolysin secretion/activation protein [Burkholderiales bacterium]